MPLEAILTLLVLLLAIVLFAMEALRVDLVALLILATLLATGVISAEQGIAGFSNQATVTVAAMMVLSGGLARTGALAPVASALGRLARRRFRLAHVTLLLFVAGISAFINNTAAVAIFLPIVLGMARKAGESPSKLLIPLSFAGIFGGTCTLVGTSTNILIDKIAVDHGQPSLGMFEFGALGVVLLVAGIAYLFTIGARILPAHERPEELSDDYDLAGYVLDVEFEEGSDSVGVAIRDMPSLEGLDLVVLSRTRAGKTRAFPRSSAVVAAGDLLRVRCGAEAVTELKRREGVAVRPISDLHDEDLEGETVLAEVVVPTSSPIVGESVADVGTLEFLGGVLLAVRQRGAIQHERLDRLRLRAGDLLLLEIPRERLSRLRNARTLLLVSEQEMPQARWRAVLATFVIAGVVGGAVIGLLPIVSMAVIGAVVLVLAGCLTMRQAYEAVDWQVIFLLAGALSLGTAMEQSGAARLISDGLVKLVGGLGPQALISAFYLLTALLTAAMSNNATAVLLAPIAISTADSLGFDSRPFLMAVAFGASASFLTPVGYQTNTLVFGPGAYRFLDFVRVGAPLVVLFWAISTFLIPRIWPI